VDAAVRARNAIERASAAIPRIALVLDREGIGDRLRRAVECAYLVIDSDVLAPAHHDGLSEGAAVVREAMALLLRGGDRTLDTSLDAAAAALEAAATDLAAGAEAVAQIQLARRFERSIGAANASPPAPRPFRASTGVPALHAFPRRPLTTAPSLEAIVPLPSPEAPRATIPRPSTLDDLAAFAAAASSGKLESDFIATPEPAAAKDAALPPFTYEYEPAIEEVEMVRRLARDCLEDIAIHRDLRKQNELETWLNQGPFEQRLLDNLDAFASFGGAALPLVSLFHAEAKAPDAGRGFAVALTLGSIEGSDTVFAAVATLKQSAPESFPGWIEGFSLGSSPMIDAAMADLCTSDRPELVALALDVLHARRATPDEVVAHLLDRPEPEIARRVARALGTTLPHHKALQQLDRLATTTSDDELFLTSVESMCLRGEGSAVALLRRAADAAASPTRARLALSLLCLVGRAADLERLLASVRASPTIDLVRGLGRFGHVEALPALIACLCDENKDLVAAAAEALERITGAGLRETVEEPWDIELPPEAAAAGGLPIPLRKVVRVITDPERWHVWTCDNASRIDPAVKTRGGVPFVPISIVHELEAPPTPADRRAEAARELRLITGLDFALSTQDWVRRQEQHLAELRSDVAGLAFSPGSWGLKSLPHAPALDDREGAMGSAPRAISSFAVEKDTRAPAPPPYPPIAPMAPVVSSHSPCDPSDADAPASTGPVTAPMAPLRLLESPLPFRAPDEAFPLRPAEVASSVRPADAALPFRAPAAPPSPLRPGGEAPTITLEQYAALCADLTLSPPHAEAIFRRYGFEDPQARIAVDLLWKERLRQNPAEYQHWQALYHRHHAQGLAAARRRGED
jgi:hypothetical protein